MNSAVRSVLIFGGVVVALIVVAVAFRSCSGGSGDKGGGFGFSSSKTIEVHADQVSLRSITETVTASGKLYPEVEVTISPEVSGELVELYVAEGDSVMEGQLLLEIDPENAEADVRRTEAALSGARANLASMKAARIGAETSVSNARRDFDRQKQLKAEGVISQADYDAAQTRMAAADADFAMAVENERAAEFTVQSQQQTLRQMRENLSRTRITSPVNGIVSGLRVKRGETVLGTAMMTGTELMKIVDLSKMEVHVDVSESDVLRIALGDTAEVEVDAYLESVFIGTVTEIATAASNDQFGSSEQATNYKVEITLLPEKDQKLGRDKGRSAYSLFPGMSATVEIRTRKAENVPSVPIQAVTTREDSTGGKSRLMEVVYVVSEEDGIALETEVKTGIQDADWIEVVEGLQSGQQIISGPYRAVSRELEDSIGIRIEEKEKR